MGGVEDISVILQCHTLCKNADYCTLFCNVMKKKIIKNYKIKKCLKMKRHW